MHRLPARPRRLSTVFPVGGKTDRLLRLRDASASKRDMGPDDCRRDSG
jgi:hypothetical protein